MKNYNYIFILLILLISCEKDNPDPADENNIDSETEFGTGWLGTDNFDDVPTSLNLFMITNGSLPTSVNLASKSLENRPYNRMVFHF